MTRRKMPKQKPGRSEQVVSTPEEFMRAVKRRLGIKEFFIDLAADHDNTKAKRFIDFSVNALTEDWKEWIPVGQWAWLNPPYNKIGPWAQKCYESVQFRPRYIALLVPASVGSNWWRDWVHGCGWVNSLNGRITFEGHDTGYPKDLALVVYGLEPGYDIWDWRNE